MKVPLQEALLLFTDADLLLHGGAAVGALTLCFRWAALQRLWVKIHTCDCGVWEAQVSNFSRARCNESMDFDELLLSINVVRWKAAIRTAAICASYELSTDGSTQSILATCPGSYGLARARFT